MPHSENSENLASEAKEKGINLARVVYMLMYEECQQQMQALYVLASERLQIIELTDSKGEE